ncbi:hypothetical protein IOD16_37595 [Saccharothrix sp. 6-C]|uniref:hypothetical protein n=1 Tax=Saccharothrix sp. 6-C TaxID=2781735 RepID=UPI0019177122|nr:hypothetical protein [Saccharothrix sp. 6-C]QQQ76631.1 hypothetical protein IOD16_37595 [Saccharothrix sp. 6-C]
MNSGFSVDLLELERLAHDLREIGGDVRDAPVWKYELDVDRLREPDPLRAAVTRYQASLRAVMERLCSDAESVAAGVAASGVEYRHADERVDAVLRRIDGDAGGLGVRR